MYVYVGEPFVYIGYYILCMGDVCTYIFIFYVVFEVADSDVILRGCLRDRWSIRCLIADEMERGFYNSRLFFFLVWPIYQCHRFQRCLCGL